uniref:Uncharacterized protein n=1 Tax=Rhizophora mucronata TaxID=61149 RepID=A0A2P2IJ11_RHIMU
MNFYFHFDGSGKHLYDTFHEPLKCVISSHLVRPETPVQKGVDAPSVKESVEMEKEKEDASKWRKKEPELTVKSALSVVFAKYAKENGKPQKDGVGETNVAVEQEAEETAT